MSQAVTDEAFVRYLFQIGMASGDQVDEAREQAAAAGIGLPEALVRMGAITSSQRENVERILAAQLQQGVLKQLGNYKIIRKLGEGGMGAVYLAEDTVALRQVALKVLPKKHAADKEFLTRFHREARAAGKLNHVNIVAAYAVGEENGIHFYVMEYCAGEPLDKVLQREGLLEVETALEIVLQVARGLEHAHAHGFIHRDIKPANIFIASASPGSPASPSPGAKAPPSPHGGEGFVAKILDLGLSKNILDTGKSFNTETGVALGTPHYISPEQACGDRNIDGRTDIYSLGATFYHLITGQTPFDGETATQVVLKHLNEQIPNPQDIREDIPDNVVQVIQKMMAKDPADRYAECAELLADLELVAKGHNPSSQAIDVSKSSVAMPRMVRANRGGGGAAVRGATGQQRPIRPIRNMARGPQAAPKNKNAVIAAGVLGLGGVALIAALLMGGSGQPNPSASREEPKPEPAPKLEKKEPSNAPTVVLSGEEAAAAEYEALLKSLKREEIEQNIAKLEEFNAKHGATLTGARARVERDKLRAPVGRWPDDWTLETSRNPSKKPVEYVGRASVLTHPLGTGPNDTRPAKWTRTMKLEAGQSWKLRGSVCSIQKEPIPDWVLVVKANGEELLNRVVAGEGWHDFEVDLARFAGVVVTLELWNQAGGRIPWGDEQGYWADVRVENPNQPAAAPIVASATKSVALAPAVPKPSTQAVPTAPAPAAPLPQPQPAVPVPAVPPAPDPALKLAAEFAEALDKSERTLKTAKLPRAELESALKALDELIARMKEAPPLIEPFAERGLGLRFDALAARDELSIYKTTSSRIGSLTALVYDFSKPEQLSAWTWDDPADAGEVLPELRKDALALRATGDHPWLGKDRKNMPLLRLPFCFKSGNWTIEARVTLVSDKNSAGKPSYGILVWDGAGSVLGLSAIEKTPRDMRIFAGGSTPLNDDFYTRMPGVPLAGRAQDAVYLKMACTQGSVSFAAANTDGKMVPVTAGAKPELGFEPRYFGLFVRANDASENAVVSFDNVKIVGIPDKQKLADATLAQRNATIATDRFLLLEAAGIKGGDWTTVWKAVLGTGTTARCAQGEFNGRPGVWESHPGGPQAPTKWVRKVKLEAARKWWLRLDVSAMKGKDWALAVKANGKELLRKTVSGAAWQAIEANLSEFAGQEVKLELLNHTAGAAPFDHEEAYWDALRIVGE